MSRPPILIKDLVQGNQVWKMLICVVDLWAVKEKNGLQHLEMVIQDTKGDQIHMTTRNREFNYWISQLDEHETYRLYNGDPIVNDGAFKVCLNKLKLVFTYNPNWPEIQRLLIPLHLKPQDHPGVISRIFKVKFDQLLSDLTKKGVLGKVVAYMYTIEFQKRGLSHALILLFLHPSNKYPRPEDIDKIISAEVPDPLKDPKLYNLVKTHKVHGPCGLANLNSPCMKSGKCSKYYRKKFQATNLVDQDGYPIYRRRDNGHTIGKNGIILHSGHAVPHNPSLLLKYEAHINIEWCNQSTIIKYLFKYINKGSDRIFVVIHSSDDNAIGATTITVI